MPPISLKDINPVFFKNKRALRSWFKKNHATETELWIGYYKVNSGKASVTWPDSVDEALCVGWIDGVRKSIDETCYTIRFTKRKPNSIWSAVNIDKVKELTAAGLMLPEGIAAFEKRKEHKSKIYAHENELQTLPDEYLTVFQAQKKAWNFFSAQAPYYRKTAIHYIMSAKQEATRKRRLDKLIASCKSGDKFWLRNQ